MPASHAKTSLSTDDLHCSLFENTEAIQKEFSDTPTYTPTHPATFLPQYAFPPVTMEEGSEDPHLRSTPALGHSPGILHLLEDTTPLAPTPTPTP